MPVDIGLCSRVVELLTRVTGSGFSGTAHPYFPTTTHLCSFGEGNSEINMKYNSGHNRKLYSIDISYNTCTLGIDMSVCFSFCLSRHVE